MIDKPHTRGFTLIELLVAMFITAILFTIGYRALQQALTSRTEIKEHTDRLLAVQQAIRIMEQDFELLQPRPVRVPIGDGYLGAVVSAQTSGSLGGGSGLVMSGPGGSALPLVTFTRGGWTNPAGIQRSELQRVSYLIDNGKLVRSYTPVLDATEASMPTQRTLIDHVKSFSLRFMDAGHQWQTSWPATTITPSNPLQLLRVRPVAVEITLELDDWGVIMRHIEVAG